MLRNISRTWKLCRNKNSKTDKNIESNWKRGIKLYSCW